MNRRCGVDVRVGGKQMWCGCERGGKCGMVEWANCNSLRWHGHIKRKQRGDFCGDSV